MVNRDVGTALSMVRRTDPSSAAAISEPVDTPKVRELVDELRESILHSDIWHKRAQLAEDATWCQWDGQSDDGLKHADGEDDDPPFPWESASDTRIRLVEEYTRKSCRVCNAAFKRGRWKLAGTEQKDRTWSDKAHLVMKWLVFTQMRTMAARERKLSLYWRNQLGVSFTYVEWETCTGYQLTDLDLPGLLEAFGLGPLLDYLEQTGEGPTEFLARVSRQGGTAEELQAYDELQNGLDLVMNPGRDGELVDTLRTLFPTVKTPKLRKATQELRQTGQTRLPQPYVATSRPVWRALKPYRDGFLPINSTSVDDARWFAIRDHLTESALREKVQTDGWSEDDVTYLLEHGEGLDSTEQIETEARQNSKRFVGGRGSWESASRDKRGLYEVFTFYYWTTDDYGIRGLYKTVCSASLLVNRTDGYAGEEASYLWHGLADLDHGRLPVVEHVYYRDSEVLMENVGIPYLLYTYQNEVKAQRDARIDHASISILPPVRRATRDQFTALTISPGSPIHEAVRGSTDWMNPPENRSLQSVELEQTVKEDAARIAGGMDDQVPVPEIQLHQQELADDYLDECVELLTLTFQMAQQLLDSATVARVGGRQAEALVVSGEDIRGSFDFRIVFDARELDTEYAQQKAKMAVEILREDTTGMFDRTKAVPDLLGVVSTEWAESWAMDPAEAQQKEIEEEMLNLGLILVGLEPPMREQGQNAQLRRQVLMAQVSGERANPEVVKQLQESELKQKIFMTRLQHLEFVHQQKTARVQDGKVGAKAVLAG